MPLSPSFRILALLIQTLMLLLPTVQSSFYKVGDLDSWGVPPPAKSDLYSVWSQSHNFTVGDLLLFLYPPSQDSVFQVTERTFKQCDTSDPIGKMTDGNSMFNITAPGNYFFISGANGHCEKKQKVEVQVASADGKFFPPTADALPPADGPSYQNVFGPMPMGLGAGPGSGAVRLGWGLGSFVGLGVFGILGVLI